MSEPARRAAPDPRLVALFVVITWTACVIAAFGVLSLTLDLDVISEADAGPLVGPLMVVGGAVILGAVLARQSSSLLGGAITAAVAVYLGMLAVGGIAYALASGRPAQLLLFPFDQIAGPFVVTAAALAGLSVLANRAVLAREGRGGTPRWPWEDDDGR